jgi:hypothetical protein
MQLATCEAFDHEHAAGACGTAQAGWLGRVDVCRHAERFAAALEGCTSSAVGEDAERADAHQSAGQDVKQEAAQELMGGNCHDLLLAAMGIDSSADGDAIVLKGHETMVGDGDAMGIAGQIVEHLFRAAEGRSRLRAISSGGASGAERTPKRVQKDSVL